MSALILALLSGVLHGQEFKIGVVNSELIIQNYPPFRQSEEQLARDIESWQSERASWEADMERLKIDIENSEEQLRTGQNTFSERRKAELQTKIDSLKFDFNQRLNTQFSLEQEKLNQRRAELFAEVFKVVNATIEELGETSGYDFIIDSSNGTVVYARNPDDLNDQLLQLLEDK